VPDKKYNVKLAKRKCVYELRRMWRIMNICGWGKDEKEVRIFSSEK